MPIDRAGNTRQAARNFTIRTKRRSFNDFVGGEDRFDYYQFRLNRSTFVLLTVNDLSDDVNLAVLNQDGRRIAGTTATEKAGGGFINANLESGVYFIRISRKSSGDARYRLVASSNGGSGSSGGTSGGGSSSVASLFRDINSGSAGADPDNLTVVGDTLFFVADDGDNGRELWRTDGTTAGTRLVSDINSGQNNGTPRSSNPDDLVNVNGVLYFSADDGDNGRELWRSDGTEAGTELVSDINSGQDNGTPRSSNPTGLVNVNGVLYFSATDGDNGRELWRSDGTEAGTDLVADINRGQASSDPTDLVSFNDTLFFAANDGTNGIELWRSDGTEAGTDLVDNIRANQSSSTPQDLTVVGDVLYFSADDGDNGRELWRSDGTEAGTELVRDIVRGSGSSNPGSFVGFEGTTYFAAQNEADGRELWRTDGTSAGTDLVRDINPNAASSDPSDLTVFGNFFYFAATGQNDGNELWRSDGTSANTDQVADINNGEASSSPSDFVVFENQLFFAATDGRRGRELWRLDGNS